MTSVASFSGQLTEKEYSRIQMAALPRILLVMPWLILGAFVAVSLSGGLRQLLLHPVSQLLRLVLVAFFAIFLFVAPRRGARTSWRNTPSARAPFSGSIDDSGITWQGELVNGRFPWSALSCYRLTNNTLYVYTGERQALWLLERFFSAPDQWQLACDLVKANLQQRRSVA